MSKIAIISLVYIFSMFENSFSFEEEDNSFANYIRNFNKKDELATNKTLLFTGYALSNLILPNEEINGIPKTAYKSEIGYGFYRSYEKLNEKIKNVRNEKQLLKIDELKNIFYVGSESVFLSNISTYFNPVENIAGSIKSDAWRFGFAYSNGYGYKLGNQPKLLLQHKSGFTWTRFDFEHINVTSAQSYLKDLDEKMKFGQFYSSSIVYSLTQSIKIELYYEKANTYNSTGGIAIIGTLVFEGALQRWVDFYETPLLMEFGDYYPFIYFAYKTAISSFIYAQKSNEHLFPFGGSKQASYNTYGIQLSFVL
jgi:hypothetical protein